MRATQSTMALTVRAGLQKSLQDLAAAQSQVSSGRRITRFSDAPVDASSALRLRANEHDLGAYAKASDDGLAWLATQDQALQSASQVLARARDLALQASNETMSPVEREAIAGELEGIRDQLARVANTTYLDRSVFGGYQTPAVSLVGTSWTWVGDAPGTAPVNRRVGSDTVVQVNLDGADVFGFSAGADLFSTIDTLAAEVRAGDLTGIRNGITTLDTGADTLRAGLGLVGTRTNQIQATRDNAELQLQTVKASQSDLVDSDLAEAAMQLAQAQNGYQAALAAAARLTLPSLVDFLR